MVLNGTSPMKVWSLCSITWTIRIPNLTECDEAIHALQKIAAELGITLAADKQDKSNTEIIFLGIVIDTFCQELQLPKGKLMASHTMGNKKGLYEAGTGILDRSTTTYLQSDTRRKGS